MREDSEYAGEEGDQDARHEGARAPGGSAQTAKVARGALFDSNDFVERDVAVGFHIVARLHAHFVRKGD